MNDQDQKFFENMSVDLYKDFISLINSDFNDFKKIKEVEETSKEDKRR